MPDRQKARSRVRKARPARAPPGRRNAARRSAPPRRGAAGRASGGQPAGAPEQVRVEGVRGAVGRPRRHARRARGVHAGLDRVVVAHAVEPVPREVQASAVVEHGDELPGDDELEEREVVVRPGRPPLRPGRIDAQGLALLAVHREQEVAAPVLEDPADAARHVVVRDEVQHLVRRLPEVRPDGGVGVRVQGHLRVDVVDLRHDEGLDGPAADDPGRHVRGASQDDITEAAVPRAVCEGQRPASILLLHCRDFAVQPHLCPSRALHVRNNIPPHELAAAGVELHLGDVVPKVCESLLSLKVVKHRLSRLLVKTHLRDEENSHGRVQAEPAEAVGEAVVPEPHPHRSEIPQGAFWSVDQSHEPFDLFPQRRVESVWIPSVVPVLPIKVPACIQRCRPQGVVEVHGQVLVGRVCLVSCIVKDETKVDGQILTVRLLNPRLGVPAYLSS
mmetsp:Transcript_75874/g.183402  ORF Transcript_75874/g.183402 Transcript_75874/m.183402 type:complete len:446 (-) Transcript_75874:616-1953(-)